MTAGASQNILYISFDGMTDTLGQSQVLPYVFGLAKLGYNFTLVSLEKPERLQEQGGVIRDLCEQNGVVWKPLKFSRRIPLISSVFNLVKVFAAIFILNRKERFCLVHCRSFMSAITGSVLKRVTGTRFVFDMRGFWVDERIEGGIIDSRLLYRVLKSIEYWLIRHADSCVVLTRAGVSELISWSDLGDVSPEKFEHITTCVDLEKFSPVFEYNFNRKPPGTHLEFLYVGSVGPWHSFDMLTAFVTAAYEYSNDIIFKMIISNGRELIENYISQRGYSPERFVIKTTPHYLIHNEFKDADLGFFFIPPVYAKIASSPTKMGEMLAAGLPIVTGHSIGDVDALVVENQVGRIVSNANYESLQKAIEETVGMIVRDRAGVMTRCRELAEDYFSLEKGVEKYKRIYEQLLHR